MLSTICLKDCSNKWEANQKIHKDTVFIQATLTVSQLKLVHTTMH
jgi:hypothetical protein